MQVAVTGEYVLWICIFCPLASPVCYSFSFPTSTPVSCFYLQAPCSLIWAKVNQGHPNPRCISNHDMVIFFNNLLQKWQARETQNYSNEICRHWIMSWNKWWKLLTVIKSTGNIIFKCVVKKENLLYVCFVSAKLFALIHIKQACVMTRIYFPSW